MKIRAEVLAIPMLLAATPAFAQSGQEPAEDLSAKVLACRDIDRNSARLKCFDQALDQVFGKDEAIVERREETFGKPRQQASEEGTLEAVIASVQLDESMGLASIRLDNGQVWQTTSNGSLIYRLRAGQRVTIARGAFSGYRLRIEGTKGFQGVRRQR